MDNEDKRAILEYLDENFTGSFKDASDKVYNVCFPNSNIVENLPLLEQLEANISSGIKNAVKSGYPYPITLPMVTDIYNALKFLTEDYKKITKITTLPPLFKDRDLKKILREYYSKEKINTKLETVLDLLLPTATKDKKVSEIDNVKARVGISNLKKTIKSKAKTKG